METIPWRAGMAAPVMVPKFALVFTPLEKFRFNDVLGLPGLKWLNALNA